MVGVDGDWKSGLAEMDQCELEDHVEHIGFATVEFVGGADSAGVGGEKSTHVAELVAGGPDVDGSVAVGDAAVRIVVWAKQLVHGEIVTVLGVGDVKWMWESDGERQQVGKVAVVTAEREGLAVVGKPSSSARLRQEWWWAERQGGVLVASGLEPVC